MIEKPPVDPETYRIVGAIMGAVNGLIFLPPKTFREVCARLVFSVSSGYGLYYVPVQFLRWQDIETVKYEDMLLGAAMIVAFVSWPLAGVIIKRAGLKISGK